MEQKSDQELIEETLAGFTGSFDELMRRHERAVFKVAYSFAVNREDALDISQTVFLKAYRSLATFRRNASVKTWLLRIAYNEGINWVRRSGVRSEVADEEAMLMVRSADDQERDLVAREQKLQLKQSLGKLNDRHRTAVVLRYFHGLPINDIASVLDCSEGMAKNILFRSVRTLRKNLAGATS